MEFPFRLPSIIGAPSGHTGPFIGCLNDQCFRGGAGSNMMNVLDALGKNSAAAQGLKKPITYGSAASLLGQRIYLCVEDKRALGFLKVGPKRLFVSAPPLAAARTNSTGVQDAFKEVNPLCVLDFYVHESCQRSGLGKRLFDTMLEQERVSPVQLAYDRPSPKLLAFLRKHCGLSRYQPQNNNFVIFDEYFSRGSTDSRGSRSSSARRGIGVLPIEAGGNVGFVGRGAVPSAPPAFRQRPPPMPGVVVPTIGMTSNDCSLRLDAAPDSAFSTNSHPPLGAPPLPNRGTSSCSSLQTPWGTIADGPPNGRGAGVSTPLRDVSNRGSERTIIDRGNERTAAGMPSDNKLRSSSVPCRGYNTITAIVPGLSEAPPSLGSSGGSTGSRRFASPLSHAGQRMLAH